MDTSQDASVSNYCALEGDPPVKIKQGLYELRYDYHETKVMFGKAPKLVIWFTVVTMGEHFNCVQLPRYYNVSNLMEKPQKWGRFKVGSKSDFLRDYMRLFANPHRYDRIPMSVFNTVIIEGKVSTVTTGAKQEAIPAPLQYSIVKELVRVKK